jgi:osmotically inducible protein OsmC
MAIRTADAEWRGNLAQGCGHTRLGSGAFDGLYNFRSRMGDGKGTNPEELLGAAHAGCFSMALSAQVSRLPQASPPADFSRPQVSGLGA